MKINNGRSLIALFIAVTMLAGCGRNMQVSADDKNADSTEKSRSEEEREDWEESEEDFEDFEDWEDWEDYESEDESEEEESSEYIEYVEWDGTETIKKSVGARRLSYRQYYNGKTYVMDDVVGGSLGADLPLVPRQEGDQLVEPEVTKFLLTETRLFYLEDNHNVFTAPWDEQHCCDLYVQFLDTGEVRKLAENVGEAVYDDGVIIYRAFIDYYLAPDEREEGIIRRIDAETGKVLDDLDFGNDAMIWYYTKDYLNYGEYGESYCYDFTTKTKEKIEFLPELWEYYCEGNAYSTTGRGVANGYKYVLRYEQGEEVNRIFPKVFSGETYFSCGKVFWLEERKIMEYILETGEEKCVCELGENACGPCKFLSVEENNGMIWVEEIGMGRQGGFGICYLYEVKDGVKTLVTDEFWTN